ncbi:hypothetical protein [Natronorubrum sp. DTA28]|uniref:hypothetical protein n=1 Tax=Natronorubrum sp. DTA28 TaxID=3447019 RepID=UPI003F86637C
MDDTNPDEYEWDVPAEWMTPVDDDILELMTENHIFDPDHIEEEDVCRAPDAAYRCRELAKRGLLKKQAIGMYDITELGEQYLAGEVDPTELEADDE